MAKVKKNFRIVYEKTKVNGIYMGVAFANSAGNTSDEWLAKRHKLKGATVTELPTMPGTPEK